jgi:glycosyltransferase involved in cell wall biosynthesis
LNATRKNAFLFAGQLEDHKGISWLISFWKKNNIVETLYIAGKGSVAIKETPNIKPLGQLTHEELICAFATVDFLIFPSLCYENSPAIIAEALAFGLPVIVSEIGGSAELINEGKNGFKFDAGNEDNLLEIIRKIKEMNIEKINNLRKQSSQITQSNNSDKIFQLLESAQTIFRKKDNRIAVNSKE